MKTHPSNHGACPTDYFRDFLNLRPIAQRVGDRLPLRDAAYAALRSAFFAFAFIVFSPRER